MKRTLGYTLAIALILAVFLVAGRLLHKRAKPTVRPGTAITIIRTDGTKVQGTYREMKDIVLQDGGM